MLNLYSIKGLIYGWEIPRSARLYLAYYNRNFFPITLFSQNLKGWKILHNSNELILNKIKIFPPKKRNWSKKGEWSDRKRTFFFISPIYKRRTHEKCNRFFRFLRSLVISREFRVEYRYFSNKSNKSNCSDWYIDFFWKGSVCELFISKKSWIHPASLPFIFGKGKGCMISTNYFWINSEIICKNYSISLFIGEITLILYQNQSK